MSTTNPYKDKPYVVEFEDGTFMIFKNQQQFRDSEHYDRDNWLMLTYAEYYSPEPSESSVTDWDEIGVSDPSNYLKGC